MSMSLSIMDAEKTTLKQLLHYMVENGMHHVAIPLEPQWIVHIAMVYDADSSVKLVSLLTEVTGKSVEKANARYKGPSPETSKQH